MMSLIKELYAADDFEQVNDFASDATYIADALMHSNNKNDAFDSLEYANDLEIPGADSTVGDFEIQPGVTLRNVNNKETLTGLMAMSSLFFNQTSMNQNDLGNMMAQMMQQQQRAQF